MDRLEFSKSIGIDPELQIKNYFNEVMGMYNLFGKYKNISIQGSVSEQVVSFDLLFKDKKEAKELGVAINNTYTKIYDYLYRIESTCNGKTVTVCMINETV